LDGSPKERSDRWPIERPDILKPDEPSLVAAAF
jgi:hypothetical protein